jgi:hypothetical protein
LREANFREQSLIDLAISPGDQVRVRTNDCMAQ